MTQFCRYRQNKLISKFSANPAFSFVRYACFTVSNCCTGYYVDNYCVDIIN